MGVRDRIRASIGDADIRRAWGMRRRIEDRAGQTWYRIEARADNAVEIHLYDEIGGWGTTAQTFVAEIGALDVSEITLRVNSGGGDIFDGMAIMNAIARHPATVTAYVDGLAASAASFIVQAADEIVMEQGSRMMIHNALGIAYGSAEEHRALADLLEQCSVDISEVYARRAGGTPAEWQARMAEETWYSADESVEVGLADRVAEDCGPRRKRSRNATRDEDEERVTPVTRQAVEAALDGERALPDLASILRGAAERAFAEPEPEPEIDTGVLVAALRDRCANRPAPTATPLPSPEVEDSQDGYVVDTVALRNALLAGRKRR